MSAVYAKDEGILDPYHLHNNGYIAPVSSISGYDNAARNNVKHAYDYPNNYHTHMSNIPQNGAHHWQPMYHNAAPRQTRSWYQAQSTYDNIHSLEKMQGKRY